ncbi:MAG: hypothetical protein OEM05_19120, partial [Myxococcales bacterium]|nr:hypothetical protein [Myxococcales bacterium]
MRTLVALGLALWVALVLVPVAPSSADDQTSVTMDGIFETRTFWLSETEFFLEAANPEDEKARLEALRELIDR